MSHFTVLVVTDNKPEAGDLTNMLAPYQENNMGDCPDDYLVFEDVEEEYRKNYDTETSPKIIMPDGTMKNPWDEEFRVAGTFGNGSGTHKAPEHLERREVPIKELYATFDDYMKDYVGYEPCGPNGEYGRWENPNAKWDYWQVGGRYRGFFKAKNQELAQLGESPLALLPTKPDSGFDSIQVDNIDYDGMKADYENSFRESYKDWKTRFDAAETDEQRQREVAMAMFILHLPKDMDIVNMTEDEYVAARMSLLPEIGFTTYAILDKKGWNGKGEMGWWGISTDEDETYVKRYSEYIRSLKPTQWLTVIDCHI